jgi:methanethiol S-methyltransferase
VQTASSLAETIAWLVAIVYATIPAFWLVVHPFAKFWRGRKGRVYPILGLIWLVIWIVVGLLTASYRHDRLWPVWSWIGWAALIAPGISIYRRIGHGFGRANLLGQAELRPQEHEQELVTTGMHGRVRHPIYLAHLLMLTAWTVGAGTIALIALWVLAVLTGIVMIRLEDRELEGRFGERYREYRRRVPAVIPKF